MKEKPKQKLKGRHVSYAKWGYFFVLPFFLTYGIFQLIPFVQTIYYSFFEYYKSGLRWIGPTFVGFQNYKVILTGDLPKYLANTIIVWLLGFIPQITIALILAAWFTDVRLKIRGKQFFKVVIYLPNLIMASAFAMLFFTLFSDNGPVNRVLVDMGIFTHSFRFLSSVIGTRGLVALMNFLMWFGNTTILLMAAIMGINPELFEAAQLDGASHTQLFFSVTLPLIRPIMVYTLITSLIGGLQMFDVPQVLTNGTGAPDRTTTTLIMFLNNHLRSKNYGMAGALSVMLFIVCGFFCLLIYYSLNEEHAEKHKKKRKKGEQA